MAQILRRELSGRPVIIANGVGEALRALERTPRIGVVVTNYRLKDGTARKLFVASSRRWPNVRRVLYSDAPRPKTINAKLAAELADAIIADFLELRRIIVRMNDPRAC